MSEEQESSGDEAESMARSKRSNRVIYNQLLTLLLTLIISHCCTVRREEANFNYQIELLKKFNLSEKDLNFYLQNKKNCYTMLLNDEIKKTASFIDSNESFKLPSGFGGAIGCAALVDFIYDTYI